MKRIALTLAALAFISIAPVAAKDDKKAEKADTTKVEKKSDYEKIVEKESACKKGMFTVHLSEGKVYFEIPDELLGRDFVMASTIKSISDNGNGVVGSKDMSGLRHVTFTKRDSTLLMREVESEYISGDEHIASAISKANIGPVMRAFALKGRSPEGACLYDVTEVFLEDDKKMTPFTDMSTYAAYTRNESFKKDLSYITDIKAFDDNVSVTSAMTYTYSMSSNGKSVWKDKPFTAVLTRSIMVLPEKIYHPRTGDYRIGLFHTERNQLGNVMNSTKTVYLTNRWRLEPSDTAAYRRGELVEPVKPIVFYIDSDFPEWWKPYIKQAVEKWQEAFEPIGFKNAIIAKDFPTDDPEFDPDNIKYSCIRYAPVGIQNATGPSWVDPRSGEIITASVYVYHDMLKLLSRWLFVQTSQADERVRHSYIPKDVLGDALCYVITHEVGHCLGLMHNMSGSSVIPVENLRDPEFTQKHGTTTSIMDYARWNYVAQKGDKERGVRLSPPGLGVYDKYAIRWSYTPVFDKPNFDEETAETAQWITDSLKKAPYYRYGKQQLFSTFFDPRNQNEDLGDDVIQATKYGVTNLKYIMQNFMEWAGDDDEEYEVRIDYYNGIINQFLTYAQHVLMNVGGLYKNDVKAADEMPSMQNVPREKQLACLNYFLELEKDLSWLAEKSVAGQLPIAGTPERAIHKSLQTMVLNAPFFASRSDGVVTKELSSVECFDILFDRIWGPTKKGKQLTEDQRDFQKLYVTTYMGSAGYSVSGSKKALVSPDAVAVCPERLACVEMDHEEHNLGTLMYSPVNGYEWMPRAIFNSGNITQATIFGEMMKVYKLLKKKAKHANATDKAHYTMIMNTIENGLEL